MTSLVTELKATRFESRCLVSPTFPYLLENE
jgi:hypothetical protein